MASSAEFTLQHLIDFHLNGKFGEQLCSILFFDDRGRCFAGDIVPDGDNHISTAFTATSRVIKELNISSYVVINYAFPITDEKKVSTGHPTVFLSFKNLRSKEVREIIIDRYSNPPFFIVADKSTKNWKVDLPNRIFFEMENTPIHIKFDKASQFLNLREYAVQQLLTS